MWGVCVQWQGGGVMRVGGMCAVAGWGCNVGGRFMCSGMVEV